MPIQPLRPLDIFLAQTRELYTMPAVAIEVLTLADDPHADAAQLKSCIERDPALAAKLLRVVNSSMYAPAHPVADLSQAVALLGVRAVKLLALGFTLPERMFDEQTSTAVAHYWQRTLLRAVAARKLATALRRREGEEAFLAALLADVGVAVLLQEATEDYPPLYEAARWGEIDGLAAERNVFEFDHRQLTRRLLMEWRLPTSIATTIDESHAGDDRSRTLGFTARLVYVAELVAAVQMDERAELWPTLCEAAERHLRLSPADLSELDRGIEAETRELLGAFHVPAFDDEVTGEMLNRARRLTPQAAEAAAGEWAARRRREVVQKPSADFGAQPPSYATSKPTRRPTALADEQLLREYLRAAAIACRYERAPLSLCFVEAERDAEADGESPIVQAGGACAAMEWPGALTTAIGAARTAIVLPRCDRRQALDWFDELRRQYRQSVGSDGTAAKLSVGIAAVGLPPRDLPVDEIVAAAERCLHAAQSSAGDAAKSIELY